MVLWDIFRIETLTNGYSTTFSIKIKKNRFLKLDVYSSFTSYRNIYLRVLSHCFVNIVATHEFFWQKHQYNIHKGDGHIVSLHTFVRIHFSSDDRNSLHIAVEPKSRTWRPPLTTTTHPGRPAGQLTLYKYVENLRD